MIEIGSSNLDFKMLFTTLLSLASALTQTALPAGDGPLSNPMKGFASYCDPGQTLYCPSEMAFEEIGWNRLEPTRGDYKFAKWESQQWDVAPAKGKNVVIRVFMDYPDQPVAVPKWLIAQGVKMTHYSEFGGGYTPDYENPILRKALAKFIVALGKRYDHDARIDYVQVGLLGHWGEWHTYPHEDLFATPEVQREVIAEMHAAFPDKPLMARNASYASCQLPWLGFHDDMIPSDTFGKDDWEFLPAIDKGKVENNWKVAPTGGEMVPGAAKQYLGTDWTLLIKAVRDAHFTWIGPYCPAMDPHLTAEDQKRVDQLIRALGYEFRLNTVSCPSKIGQTRRLNLALTGTNQGSAPFYAPWKVRMALLDSAGVERQSWIVSCDVRKWLPGDFALSTSQELKVGPGNYRIGIGIIDPSSQKPGIKFANRLKESGGYAILGSVQVVNPLTR
jgi:hypothetical protein